MLTGYRFSESRMREIRSSGLSRGRAPKGPSLLYRFQGCCSSLPYLCVSVPICGSPSLPLFGCGSTALYHRVSTSSFSRRCFRRRNRRNLRNLRISVVAVVLLQLRRAVPQGFNIVVFATLFPLS
jgi:hypothetical protein